MKNIATITTALLFIITQSLANPAQTIAQQEKQNNVKSAMSSLTTYEIQSLPTSDSIAKVFDNVNTDAADIRCRN
jgi:hypothetical protein